MLGLGTFVQSSSAIVPSRVHESMNPSDFVLNPGWFTLSDMDYKSLGAYTLMTSDR